MKVTNLSFLTPLTNTNKIVLEKNYSQNLLLPNGSSINLSSNIGPKENQEDSLAITENNGYLLLLVADGMGGLEHGEEASYNIAKIIKSWIDTQTESSLKKLNEITLEDQLTDIIDLVRKNILSNNTGTTLNMSIIGPEKTLIANIGDSRTYSIKNSQITLQTRDDSVAFRRFNATTAAYRDFLRFYEDNHVVTNSIIKDFLPSIAVTTINNDDYDILCHITDGVSDILTEEQIRTHLMQNYPAESLVTAAISSGIVYNPHNIAKFYENIYPHDNASAIVYTKKR